MSTSFPDAHTDEIPVGKHVSRAKLPRFIRTFAVPVIIGWIALIALLRLLGYQVESAEMKVTPPAGRKAIFVGDLVDRGPGIASLW